MKKTIIVAVLIVAAMLFTGCGGEKIVWEDMILGEQLPQPPLDRGKVHFNNADDLWVDVVGVSNKQYFDYTEACKEKGFTIDSDTGSNSYEAFNAEGYKLSLRYYSTGEEMAIDLEKPMELETITWPKGVAGEKIPAPKSTIGKFSYEYDDHFFVYVGNMTKDDYSAYVAACSERGFNVDYSKGDNYYRADNAEGWSLSLEYEGYNVISISIKAPEETTESTDMTTSVELPESTDASTSEGMQESSAASDGVISSDFKVAMDSYEKFMDEYVAFMKKYMDNPTDMSLVLDYANYSSKYADVVEKFEKWNDEEMNTAEMAYYIDVQARVSKKLLEVAQ